MPDLNCDTLGLATLRTAVSVGHEDSLIWLGRSQATTRVSLGSVTVDVLGVPPLVQPVVDRAGAAGLHPAGALAGEGGDQVSDCVSDARAD